MANHYLTLILLLPALSCRAVPPIPTGYQRVAHQAHIPAELLYAVALTESGTRLSRDVHPWPWTLNVEGRAYLYTTRLQACSALKQFLRTRDPRRIDAGLGQINIGWNGQFFTTPCDALDPYLNLQIAAQLLRGHFNTQHSWLHAAGRYHHPAGGLPALRYRQKVAHFLQQLQSS
ncbi:transglycosylase SLT domain-containing protein [Citrobacter portucalensis]|uniref:transglycosylase SLT domain-containing protein n=1 Tax=Citrobacter portucalensis TaxID=1639133 RepID=UPI00226BB45A|nr:transglycosylase SLT domain-containing protein [Citrobacter portucalensis]MCX8984259.1 transglycosylase SLT domain-containing protein [Citrobacter portucalensis]